jgi:hypothetical protein
VLYFVFPRPDRWVVGWESTIDGGGDFYFVDFSTLVGFEDVGCGGFFEGWKSKSKHGSRGEKRWRELEAREEPAQRFARASGSTTDANKPSEECKATVFHAFYKWFRDTSFSYINRNFLALGDVVGKDAFQSHMHKVFEDAISKDKWEEDKLKFSYNDWIRDRLIDALYNTEPFLRSIGDSKNNH